VKAELRARTQSTKRENGLSEELRVSMWTRRNLLSLLPRVIPQAQQSPVGNAEEQITLPLNAK